MDGQKDGRTDGCYFIGPFRPRPGVQQTFFKLLRDLRLACNQRNQRMLIKEILGFKNGSLSLLVSSLPGLGPMGVLQGDICI